MLIIRFIENTMETQKPQNQFERTDPSPQLGDITSAAGNGHEQDSQFEYHILGAGMESTGEWVSGEKLRMDYLRTTDGLIQKITRGAEVTNPATGETERTPFSTVIFLDKSARPVSHFVRELWPLFAKDIHSGEVPPLPTFRFLNIDRRQWIDRIDPNWSGAIDPDRIDTSFVRSLRSIFLSPEAKRQIAETDPDNKDIDTMPASLDNQAILVVDETHYSGDTLRVATGLLGRAFPTAHVDGAYWMREKVGGHNRNPRWYDDSNNMGRGVNQRYSEIKKLANAQEKTLYQKIGSFFLSAPHWRVQEGLQDHSYRQLVKEIKHLAAHPDVPIMPSRGRKDAEDRVIAYNTTYNPSQLTEDEKDAIINNVITRKNDIEQRSAQGEPL